MKKKSSEMSEKQKSSVENKKPLPVPPAQARKKGQEIWQDMVKFQQELINMQTLEEDQDMRLMRLECILKRFQKNLSTEGKCKTELNRTAKYYVNQLAKLDVEAKRLKNSSEKKIEMLQELKVEAEQYLNLVKEEEQRHHTTITALNNEVLKNLEKLKKIASEEFQDLEALLKPSSRWIFFTKSNRSPSADTKLDGAPKNGSIYSMERPKTQLQERTKMECPHDRPKATENKKDEGHQQENKKPSAEHKDAFIFGTNVEQRA